jgi:ribonuclease HII
MGCSPFYLAGCDEAGRGALAGPVVAAAVILDYSSIDSSLLGDSKQLSGFERERAYCMLRESDSTIAFSIINHKVVDTINVLSASLLAMARAVRYLPLQPHKVVVDGNKCPIIENVAVSSMVKGDQKLLEISAASIVAKVIRDRIMNRYNTYFSEYRFEKHKGYGTKDHYDALFQNGPCKIHRKSFSLSKQLSLF